jgi:hypothetical protein
MRANMILYAHAHARAHACTRTHTKMREICKLHVTYRILKTDLNGKFYYSLPTVINNILKPIAKAMCEGHKTLLLLNILLLDITS